MESNPSSASPQTASEEPDTFTSDVTKDPAWGKFEELRKAAASSAEWGEEGEDPLLEILSDSNDDDDFDLSDILGTNEQESDDEHADEDSSGEGNGDDGVALATDQPYDPEVGRIKVALLYSGIDQKDIDGMSVGSIKALGARLFDQASQQRDELTSDREPQSRQSPPQGFDDILAEYSEGLTAEFGEEGADALGRLFKAAMQRVEDRFSRIPEESARHAEGQQAVLREVSRFEGLNPQLKGDEGLRGRLIATAKALSETGAYEVGPTLFDAAARALGLQVAPPSKPKTSTQNIIKTQPNSTVKPSKKNSPRDANSWDKAWIRLSLAGKGEKTIHRILGPRPE